MVNTVSINTCTHFFSIALCDELDGIENGRIEYNPDTPAPYSVSTVAVYICDPGYELTLTSGIMTRTCTDNGDGNGASFDGVAPTCERKHIVTPTFISYE